MTVRRQAFANHLNSPFSSTNPDRSENVGLLAPLAFVAGLRRADLPSHIDLTGSLFGRLFDANYTEPYTPERREQMLEHYESYLSRIYMFEQIIRYEALIRYQVLTSFKNSQHVTQLVGMKKLVAEQGSLLEGMLVLLREMADVELKSAAPVTKHNAGEVIKVIKVVDEKFMSPLINFRNRVAHGYARSFNTDLRRGARVEVDDPVASRLFDEANVMIATSVVDTLDATVLLLNNLPQAFSANGTMFDDQILNHAALSQHSPHLAQSHPSQRALRGVDGIPASDLKEMIVAPNIALENFWIGLKQ